MKNTGSAQEFLPPKRRLFTGVIISLPIFFFLLLEMLLRALSYGPNLMLFSTQTISQRALHIMNPDVKGRYFSNVQFSPNASYDYFVMPKPAGTYRVFCLGGSTTAGFPYGQVGSFSTFLRDRLRAVFPKKNIEVINLGMTATNSFTVVDLAKELSDYGPDLLLVYDGHNEFYGALGVSSHESLGSRWAARTHLALVRFKIYLLLQEVVRGLGSIVHSESGEDPGTLMERMSRDRIVPYGSKVYVEALATFRENLEELTSITKAAGIPVILGTQVSNLRDLPPFVSEPRREITPGERLRFEELVASGRDSQNRGFFRSAVGFFRQAFAIDSTSAILHYHLARCLDTLGDTQSALRHYLSARDLDQLRFRASSDFNNVIRDFDDRSTVIVADIEQAFKAESHGSLVGSNLISEHLHPRLWGYFLMAKTFASTMRKNALLAPDCFWMRMDSLDESRLWSERSVTPFDEKVAARRIQLLTSGWPFKSEPRQIPAFSFEDSVGQIIDGIVLGKLTWEEAHVAVAELHARSGDLDAAEHEYRALMRQFPYSVSPSLRLGQILMVKKNYEAAKQIFSSSLDIEPTAYGLTRIGAIALEEKNPLAALPHLERAYSLSITHDDRLESAYHLGLAYFLSGQSARARAPLQAALQLNPQFQPARQLLRKLAN